MLKPSIVQSLSPTLNNVMSHAKESGDAVVAFAVYSFAVPSSAVTVYFTPSSAEKSCSSPDAGLTVAPGDSVMVGVSVRVVAFAG